MPTSLAVLRRFFSRLNISWQSSRHNRPAGEETRHRLEAMYLLRNLRHLRVERRPRVSWLWVVVSSNKIRTFSAFAKFCCRITAMLVTFERYFEQYVLTWQTKAHTGSRKCRKQQYNHQVVCFEIYGWWTKSGLGKYVVATRTTIVLSHLIPQRRFPTRQRLFSRTTSPLNNCRVRESIADVCRSKTFQSKWVRLESTYH